MPTILENLTVLREVIERTPEDRYNLDWFVLENECGTLHCTYGWASTIPFFRAQGMVQDTDDWPKINGVEIDSDPNPLDPLFGPSAYLNLFSSTGMGYFDGTYTELHSAAGQEGVDAYDLPADEHKALALYRIDRQIELVKGTQV